MLTRRMFCVSAAAAAGGCDSAKAEPLRLTTPRATHTMLAAPDGSVLIIGGCNGAGCSRGPGSQTVDRYDPKTGTIRQAGELLKPRVEASSALLADGTVLIAGGWVGDNLTATSVERFDPRTGRSQAVGEMSEAQACQAIALSDGRVLLLGPKAIDLYDPATHRIALVSRTSPYLDAGSATLLADGRVLTAGGGTYGHPPMAEAFLIEPETGRVERTGDLNGVRIKHAAVRLADDRVLMIGGSDARGRDGGKTRSLEVYDPRSGRFSRVGESRDARFKIPAAATRLADGRVLVAGGADQPEVIDPATWTSRPVALSIGEVLSFTTAVGLPNGDALICGGYGERNIRPVDSAWLIPRAAMA